MTTALSGSEMTIAVPYAEVKEKQLRWIGCLPGVHPSCRCFLSVSVIIEADGQGGGVFIFSSHLDAEGVEGFGMWDLRLLKCFASY